MNRIASRSTLSSRHRARAVAGLLAAGLLTGLGQGTALAAEAPAEHTAAAFAGLTFGGLLDEVGGLLSGVLPPSKNNNDWQ
ncbi:hypothetical protein [Streptomyces incanus]|uniref:Secreted protein n=1 Tax=Streptomyces incanus TaxID=887453 RepID=A0ABW0XX11_9ACTN